MSVIPLTRANALADHVCGTTQDTAPAAIYVALVDSLGDELVGSGYARQLVTFGAAANRTAASNVEVEFGPATADWVEIHGVELYDAVTGGALQLEGPIPVPQTVNDTQRLIIEVGDLSFTVDPPA